MKFRAEEIISVLKSELEEYSQELNVRDVGRVLEVGDGIARIYGLTNAMAGELLEFENGIKAQVFNLEEDSIGAVVMGDCTHLHEGMVVRGTGRVINVPVGDALIGRVVDALGAPIDGKGPIQTEHHRLIEIIAPGIAQRQPVKVPLQTGLKAIDSMIPIGRGQRELIIGDRKTGKTAIATDTVINQKGQGVICVYVAIGQKESTVASVVAEFEKRGAMEYTVVVSAPSAAPASLQFLSPYAGAAIAEYFMYEKGLDTLCVYDDLTKQAQAYRQVSLLLRRPPGREAYPGDVFYLHSRLLERAVKTAEKYVVVPESLEKDDITEADGVGGCSYETHIESQHEAAEKVLAENPGHVLRRVTKSGGSMTALPIIETQEGEVSAYIPTNVISITDGQIYLVPDLFYAGVRPAVDVGISVSRVGGNAQTKAMKSVAGMLRLDLASFRELEAFAQLGTELDAGTQAKIDRGRRMVELLKQGQYAPLPVEEQVLVIFAGARGHFDSVPALRIREAETALLEQARSAHPELLAELRESGKLSDDLEARLGAYVDEFVNAWLAGEKVDPR